jgi:hypothetical protein
MDRECVPGIPKIVFIPSDINASTSKAPPLFTPISNPLNRMGSYAKLTINKNFFKGSPFVYRSP